MAVVDVTTLTDQELKDLQVAVSDEQNKRYALTAIPQQMAVLNAGYLTAEGTTEGDAWRQPTGAHDAYPKDWIAAHNGKDWRSLLDANVWEPGVANWAESVAPGGGYPLWVQPTGATDAYHIGDKVHYMPTVKNYESLIDGNTWSPEAYPAGWKEIP
jgi:hypothetical protein